MIKWLIINFPDLKTATRLVPRPPSEGAFSLNSFICVICEWPTHLVISQSDQDDVWRVNPDLEETKQSRDYRVSYSNTALCDPHTRGQLSPRCHINGGWLTIENTLVQHYVGGFPVCAGGVKGARGQSGHSYLFPEFSSDVAKPLGAIKAHGLQTSVPQHFNHLSIFWKTQESRGWLVQGNKLSIMSLKSEIWTSGGFCTNWYIMWRSGS